MRYPLTNIGQSLLQRFDVPVGGFPVPWGTEEEEEERNRSMGVIPAIAYPCPFAHENEEDEMSCSKCRKKRVEWTIEGSRLAQNGTGMSPLVIGGGILAAAGILYLLFK